MVYRIVLAVLLIFLSGLARANERSSTISGSTFTTVAEEVVAATDAITIPRLLSYQGRLTDSLGNPVPDGSYQLTYRLYTQETGGTPFWNEVQTVSVRNGIFSVLLGSVTPISSIPDAGAVYLSLQVGTGSELTPRLRIVSAAYAFLTERAANSDLLQGKDTTALDARYVNEGQANSVTSAMITDGAVGTADIANIAVTSAKIGNGEVTMAKINQSGATTGQVIKWNGTQWAPADDAVGAGDNAWVRGTPDSVLYTIRQLGIARGGSDNMLYGNYCCTQTNLGVACTTGINGQNHQFCTVGGGFRNRASSSLATVAGGRQNTAGGIEATVAGGRENAATGNNATVGGGFSNTATEFAATVAGGRSNQARSQDVAIGGGAGNIAWGQAATIAGGNQNRDSGYVATISGGGNNIAYGDGATIGGGMVNSVISSNAVIGGGALNQITGLMGVIGGGHADTVKGVYGGILAGYSNLAGDGPEDTAATVAGGYNNAATARQAFVGGGRNNTASGTDATVGGGENNSASADGATIGGGVNNQANGWNSTIAGGGGNTTTGTNATIGGGYGNVASGDATVAGGHSNFASGFYSAIAGGESNLASGNWAAVAGGWYDTSAANYSFTTGYLSVVPSGYSNSAAFNGQTATASNQLRCGTLSKAGGSFTIDHPLDPYGKILNHYFVEGPEMLNIYRGVVTLDASGRAEVRLPDYFSALNRNPHIQLTGVGSPEVYVAEKITGNRFVIGGRPGMEVFWQVTGERADVSAEVIRRLMPVEQKKTGALDGRMLDDEFLAGCMEQLEREGKTEGINFRTPAGRQRYEQMKSRQTGR
ncbi:MAG: hypothetical protein ABIK48_01400 [candidate division WOR-3 bacterium]